MATKKKNSNPHLVVQSNQFLNFRHTLGLAEARVFLSMVAQIEKDDEDFKTYRIEVKKFMDLVGLKGHGNHGLLRQVAEGLAKKQFKQVQPDGSFLVIGYISSAEYVAGRSYVELSFDPKLKPFLLNLKEAFTQYDIRHIISLRSYNTVRLYELLKQYEKIKYREFTVQGLKDILNLEGKYARYADFKSAVLEVAKRELAKTTDISFDYEEIREGKSVVRLRFLIHSNNNDQGVEITSPPPVEQLPIQPIIIVDTQPSPVHTLFKEIDASLTDAEIDAFVEKSGVEESDLMDVLIYAQQEKKKGIQIRSILAYVQSGLKNGLGSGLSQRKNAKAWEEAEKRRLQREDTEIRKWLTDEFPLFLSDYYERKGSEASDTDKFAFIAYINEEIKKAPAIKPMYYDNDGKLNPQQMRISLGMELVKEAGITETDLFIEWVAANRQQKIALVNGRWQTIQASPF